MTKSELEKQIRTEFARKGGYARASKMTPAERIAHSKMMVQKREEKRLQKKGE